MKVSKPTAILLVDPKTGHRVVEANTPFDLPDEEAEARIAAGEELTRVDVPVPAAPRSKSKGDS